MVFHSLCSVECVLLRQRAGFSACFPHADRWWERVYFSVWERRVWTLWYEQVHSSSAFAPPLPATLAWNGLLNDKQTHVVFTGVKPTDQMLACAWACEWGLCYVWRTPPHHLHLQTLCNLNLFVAFMLYWPPKVKERDLDLKHKSSLQALELSLPLNAADQCPFLLKIKPFWTLKAFHCWAVPKCHIGEWAEKSPFFP